MKELRLEYKKDTGAQIHDTIEEDDVAYIYHDKDGVPVLAIDNWLDIKEYIEWLEEKLLDDEALFKLMNKILHEKNKTTGEHIHDPDE